jgi:hypothetical protein
VDELVPGLSTWTERHPNWSPDQEHWGPDVRSYALLRGDEVVLFDPLDPPRNLLEGRTASVVLTAEWHKRSSPRLGLPVHDTGDPLPDGVEERQAFYLPEERFLWLPAQRALIAGDSLPNAGQVPDAWLDVPRERYTESLRPLLDLPIELLLPTHGDPVLEDAHGHLERVLGSRGR